MEKVKNIVKKFKRLGYKPDTDDFSLFGEVSFCKNSDYSDKVLVVNSDGADLTLNDYYRNESETIPIPKNLIHIIADWFRYFNLLGYEDYKTSKELFDYLGYTRSFVNNGEIYFVDDKNNFSIVISDTGVESLECVDGEEPKNCVLTDMEIVATDMLLNEMENKTKELLG